MTTHLSTRLVWHDRGWDGRVCDSPHLNAHCIVHKHIRDSRDDRKEREAASRHFGELGNWLPPCSRDPAAYAERGFVIEHRDPLEFRQLPPVSEDIPPYSACPAPYRWMREEFFREICETEDITISGSKDNREHGWVFEPDRQRELLKRFWGKLESHKSLVFYYCNHGNPLDEKASRIIVGVGRISEIGPQIYFGTTNEYRDQYPVWSRRITQAYPSQGVRIPYQEYLQEGYPTDDIICRVPRNALLAFSYGGEHVSDDLAVAILERVIQCVERIREDKYVVGNWEDRLTWLNDALDEVWTGRGPFPGASSVLRYLGFSKATLFQRKVLAPMAQQGSDPWDYVLSILEGKIDPKNSAYREGLLKARERWGVLKSRQALLSKLARFELSPRQVERIANPDQRVAGGINATEEELVANPYILSESDFGTADSDPVALETIDHGLRPEGNVALFLNDDVDQDDRRRVRAVGVAILNEAADNGDTVLTFDDFLERISCRFPKQRACRPDRGIVLTEVEFYRSILWTDLECDPELIALKHLQNLEQIVASTIKRRAKKVNPAADPPIDWFDALKKDFSDPVSDQEHAALKEKELALDTLFSRRLSVLTGGAGTGKTSVLRVFLQELVRSEGRHPTLLLAPTGKARVRLSTATKRNAETIHQFLLRQEWFMPGIFTLKTENDKSPFQATTVIVDECSMLPIDLLGTLLLALDSGPLKRLILVGDPNQLPPIGPGRPFADIIEWLRKKHPECIAPLNVCMRTGGHKASAEHSVVLSLADGYRTSTVSPGDDEILAAVARGESAGDLEIAFWNNHEELLEVLRNRMAENLKIKKNDYLSFNRSLGIDTKNWKRSENWQILSPTRTQYFGTDDLNRRIQLEYRGKLIAKARKEYSKSPRPFGDQEIVYADKVIQVVNQRRQAWPRNSGLDYVANGEIGIVTSTSKGKGNENPCLDVVFSTQFDVSYRYYNKQPEDSLELAYALTVHKAQGSDFDTVFLIIPQNATNLSRELIYTGLTRFQSKLVLLIEKDIEPLRRLRNPDCSDTQMRNTHLFTLAIRPGKIQKPHLEALIHRTRRGDAVRSKSEVIVADILDMLGISYEYEKPLYSRSNEKDFRLPDFTVSFEGDIYYWEHLGMLNVPSYFEAWQRKRQWYEDNGYAEQLIVSEDGRDGSINATQIERIARKRILEE